MWEGKDALSDEFIVTGSDFKGDGEGEDGSAMEGLVPRTGYPPLVEEGNGCGWHIHLKWIRGRIRANERFRIGRKLRLHTVERAKGLRG